MSQAYEHRPVMVAEVVELFAGVPPGTIVDATVGGGGHAAALLRSHPQLRVLAIDQDQEAVAAAAAALAPMGDRAVVRHACFDELGGLVEGPVSGVLFDLGVSSAQLDDSGRGFSYRADGPLDMRMDRSRPRTAQDVVNTLPERRLAELFAQSGQRRFAGRIARAIVSARPLRTTGELAAAVRDAVPAPARRSGGHPARRVFQAVRIEVNSELDLLGPAIDAAIDLLVPGGRCVVLSYHSGEDRIVKERFVAASTGNCGCPPGLPCTCGARPKVRLLNRRARRPSPAEIESNRRADSARLRAVERLADGDRSGARSARAGEQARRRVA
jgi:16S rRNA (cytosine1402-N4)-methyltransferase